MRKIYYWFTITGCSLIAFHSLKTPSYIQKLRKWTGAINLFCLDWVLLCIFWKLWHIAWPFKNYTIDFKNLSKHISWQNLVRWMMNMHTLLTWRWIKYVLFQKELKDVKHQILDTGSFCFLVCYWRFVVSGFWRKLAEGLICLALINLCKTWAHG